VADIEIYGRSCHKGLEGLFTLFIVTKPSQLDQLFFLVGLLDGAGDAVALPRTNPRIKRREAQANPIKAYREVSMTLHCIGDTIVLLQPPDQAATIVR
jgi:hypothetical protein